MSALYLSTYHTYFGGGGGDWGKCVGRWNAIRTMSIDILSMYTTRHGLRTPNYILLLAFKVVNR